MPLDGITINFFAKELDKRFNGSRIEKVSQPDRFTIDLKLRSHDHSDLLRLCSNPSDPYVSVSENSLENPSVPLRFCSILRKYLSGARITEIKAVDFERIILIRLKAFNELGDQTEFSLVAEIMGRHSNLILVNKSDTIIDSMIHVDFMTSRVREVLPAHPYDLPPSQNKVLPIEFSAESNIRSLWEKNPDKFPEKVMIENITGFSPLISREIIERSGIESRAKCSSMTSSSINDLNKTLLSVINEISSGKICPTVIFSDQDRKNPKDFHALRMVSYPYTKTYNDLISAITDFYSTRELSKRLSSRKRSYIEIVERKIRNFQNLKSIHISDVEDSKEYERDRLFGDLIYANIFRIKLGDLYLEAEDFSSTEDRTVRIPLDPMLSPSRNAQNYYRRFRKLKSKHDIAGKFLKQEERTIAYLETFLITIVNANNDADFEAIESEIKTVPLLSRAFENSRSSSFASRNNKRASITENPANGPRRYISTEGIEIIIGRNNIQNDKLTFKTASKTDIWMHVHNAPGTHTIIRTANGEAPSRSLEEAAKLTAWFSRKDISRDTKAIVDYCNAKYVTKQKGSEPGHVFYRNYESITVYPELPSGVTIISG